MPRLPIARIVEGGAAPGVGRVPELGRVVAPARVDALVHRRDEHAEVQDYRGYLQAEGGGDGYSPRSFSSFSGMDGNWIIWIFIPVNCGFTNVWNIIASKDLEGTQVTSEQAAFLLILSTFF